MVGLIIFLLTYAVLGFGALPPLRVDRTGAALIGATAMVACGVLRPHEAVAAIDFHTLALLFGMMLVVAHLRLAGFFGALAAWARRRATTPSSMLAMVVVLAAAVSALFVNDTACILLTPFALECADGFGVTPLPFLLAVAMGSNAGSVATLVGNPQNMLVGSFSGIPYARFAAMLAPVAAFATVAVIVALRLTFRRELTPRAGMATLPAPALNLPLLRKVAVVTVLLLVALLAGAPPGIAALSAGAVLLVTRRVDPGDVYAHVDWGLLAMFAGLFIVVRGVEASGWTARGLALLPATTRHSLPVLAGATTVLSNVVSNVPAVLVLRAWPPQFPKPDAAWLTLAATSTLAGNLTLVGSVANLIVVEQARPRARVGFLAYARVGVPVALLTLVVATAWIWWVAR